VLAGGGVKGIGLVGSVVRLMEAGYRANRIAGTSAGSIVGSIVAAAAKTSTVGPQDIRDLVLSLDYGKFLDPGPIERVPLLGPAWAILQGNGVYKGDYVRDFVAAQLKSLGVETFGDLRLDDDQVPEDRRYRLVVTATDVTRGQLVRLPWDYRGVYGLDPDEQPVADAVRASMSTDSRRISSISEVPTVPQPSSAMRTWAPSIGRRLVLGRRRLGPFERAGRVLTGL
jgi:NTE family protein